MGTSRLITKLNVLTLSVLLLSCGKVVNTATNVDDLVGRETVVGVGASSQSLTSFELTTLQSICDKLTYKRLYLNNSQRRFNTSISALTCTATVPVQESPVLALAEVNGVVQFNVVSNGPSSFFFSKYENDQQGMMKKFCAMLIEDVKSKVVNAGNSDQLVYMLNFNAGECEAVGSSLNGNLTCFTIEEAIQVRPSTYRTVRAHKFYMVNGQNATYRGFLAKRDYSEECTDPEKKLSIQSTTTSID
jgi:hypothetical protein